MTLLLDERRIAMLAEFGIRLPPLPVAAEEAQPSVPAVALAPEPQALAPSPRATLELAPRAIGIELMEWDALGEAVAACRACKLCATRRNTVFGVGDRQADWLIVGEAPGENEDIQGEPFVGQAGKLLDNMLRALGLSRRENVYIANVL
jgi:DNA polymerase